MDRENSSERPEVYALRKDGGNWQLSRRDFLKAAGVGAAVLGVGSGSGCSREKPTETAPAVTGGTAAADSTAAADDTAEGGSTSYNNKGMEVTTRDPDTGKTVTYSQSCGDAIPEGALCTCNCISYRVDYCLTYGIIPPTSTPHYWYPN